VNAATLSARPLYFTHGRDHYIEASQDVNYSAVILPPPVTIPAEVSGRRR
jgi:hypothetical protein